MSPLAVVATIEGVAVLGLIWIAAWLLDHLGAERARTAKWRDECRAWQDRGRRGGRDAHARN